jgi:flagellar protein FliJ
MPFRFRLQSVLEHRAHQKEMAMAKLAEQLGLQRKCREQIAWLRQESERARQELGLREGRGVSAREFILANDYLTVLRLHGLREEARLPGLVAQAQEARAELIEAQRDHRALEILREQHLSEYRREQMRQDQILLDEAAINSHARKEPS